MNNVWRVHGHMPAFHLLAYMQTSISLSRTHARTHAHTCMLERPPHIRTPIQRVQVRGAGGWGGEEGCIHAYVPGTPQDAAFLLN